MSYEQAVRFREAGDREAIVELFRQNPEDARIAYQCAWTHDKLGLEAEAVEFYQAALEHGLAGEERQGAYLGLGSTLRCLARLEDSLAVLDRGLTEFPQDRALAVFRCLTLYNLGRYREAVGTLLTELVATTSDPRLQSYRRALSYYAENLDPDPHALSSP